MAAIVIFARRLRPAAFSLTLACVSVGVTWIGYDRVPGPWEQVVGVGGVLTAALLTLAWVVNSNRLLRWSLLAATVLWVYVAVVAIETLTSATNWMLAVSWSSLAGGTYWMEQRDYVLVKQRLGEA